jgi:hypothetical protein
MSKLQSSDILRLIDHELEWCNSNPSTVSEEYRNGFIKGVEQVKYLIEEAEKLVIHLTLRE